MRIPFFMLILFFVTACSSRKEMSNDSAANTDSSNHIQNHNNLSPILASIDRQGFGTTSDPIEIKKATISGDILSLDVTYSGGCEKHEFELIGSGMYIKTMPPKMAISLKHYANGDGCRKLCETSLKINVKDLRYAGEGPLILMLEGTDNISYRY